MDKRGPKVECMNVDALCKIGLTSHVPESPI